MSFILSKKQVMFYTVGFILVCLGMAWKPLVVVAWRLSHRSSVTVGYRRLTVPFPWVLTVSRSSVKAKSFVTLWPNFSSRDVTAIIEETPSDQSLESDAKWSSDRAMRFASNGYSNIHNESYKGGQVLCSVASKGSSEIAYCKSNTKFNLVYSGPLERLNKAIALLPLE
jgi:hypothetical protein